MIFVTFMGFTDCLVVAIVFKVFVTTAFGAAPARVIGAMISQSQTQGETGTMDATPDERLMQDEYGKGRVRILGERVIITTGCHARQARGVLHLQ